MDGNSALTLTVGLLVRIGIPVLITIGLVTIMRRLDTRWQTIAEKQGELIPLTAVRNSGCWDKHNCSPETRAKCPAYLNPDVPCWHVHRSKSGMLKESCIGCEIFRDAPIPVSA